MGARITQPELARAVGVKLFVISTLETCRRAYISTELLRALEAKLGIDSKLVNKYIPGAQTSDFDTVGASPQECDTCAGCASCAGVNGSQDVVAESIVAAIRTLRYAGVDAQGYALLSKVLT